MNLFEQAKQEASLKPAPGTAVSYRRESDTSRAGAADAELSGKAADQMTRYLAALVRARHQGLTDHEAAALLELPVTSICARRGSKHGRMYVVDSGSRRRGPTGVANTVWIHVLFQGQKDANES